MSLDLSFEFDATLQELENAGVPHNIRLYRTYCGAKKLHTIVQAISNGTVSLYQDLDNRHIDQLVFSYKLARNVFDNGHLVDMIENDTQYRDFFDTLVAVKEKEIKTTIRPFF